MSRLAPGAIVETVFFATNRNPVETSIPNNFGTDFSGAGLAWGRVIVQEAAAEGDLSQRNMAVCDVAPGVPGPEMERALLAEPIDHLVVLVHGFDLRFREAAMQAAWLRGWLAAARPALAAGVLVFSWPSLGSLSAPGYAADRVNARLSAAAMRQALRVLGRLVPRFRRLRPGRRVHLVAHGLGAAVIEGALDMMGGAPRANTNTDDGPLFDTAALVQADVAHDAPARAGLARLPDLAARIALYHDARDTDLARFAARLDGVPRLGHVGPLEDALARGPWEAIDCAALPLPRTIAAAPHHAWRLSPILRDDLAALMAGTSASRMPHRERLGGLPIFRLNPGEAAARVARP
jgi:esterase/lipase superfamily enzyme